MMESRKEQRRQINLLFDRISTLEKLLYSGRRRLGQLLEEYLDETGVLSEFDIDQPTLDLLIAAGSARRTG